MARKKKKYNLKSKLTSAIRRLWFYGPTRYEKVKQLKANGFRCEKCNKPQDKLEIDHINPVVRVTGFTTWDEYISRMFVDPEGLQGLCKACHSAKTITQREIRKKYKKILTKKAK